MPGDEYNADSFQAFYEGWLVRQEHYLDELLSAARRCHETADDVLEELISRVLSHYEEYYEKKFRVAQRDVFLVFSPTWFTSYERSLLWIGGFRPGIIFRLVNGSLDDLSDQQTQSLRRLKDDMKIEGRALNNDLAKIQEKVAAPPLLEIFRRFGSCGHDGFIGDATGMNTMKEAFQSVLASADFLRRNATLKVVEILTPAQAIKFSAAVTQLQLRIRASGLQMDDQRRDPGCGGVQ